MKRGSFLFEETGKMHYLAVLKNPSKILDLDPDADDVQNLIIASLTT